MGSAIDYVRRQVLTSRNIRGGRLTDWILGGLNYQIEHHLFPSMPRPGLRRAQTLVRGYCAGRGIAYHEAGIFDGWWAGGRQTGGSDATARRRSGQSEACGSFSQ